MTDFTYKGALVTEKWPTAARIPGTTRTSYERWTATFDDLTTLAAGLGRGQCAYACCTAVRTS